MIPTERLKGTRESRHTQSPGLCFRIVLTYGETETFYLLTCAWLPKLQIPAA
jgi:hypothetical protein